MLIKNGWRNDMGLDKVNCINLKHRTDRFERTLKEFFLLPFDFNVERIDAFYMNPGWEGCKYSHLYAIEKCKNDEVIFIVEDDVKFILKNSIVLKSAINQLPPDWEILYLGVNFMSAKFEQKLKLYSPNLVQVTQGYGCYAYIINNTNGLAGEILRNRENMRKIDVFYETTIQPRGKCFAIYPMLATCYDSFSDITRKQTDYEQRLYEAFYGNIEI